MYVQILVREQPHIYYSEIRFPPLSFKKLLLSCPCPDTTLLSFKHLSSPQHMRLHRRLLRRSRSTSQCSLKDIELRPLLCFTLFLALALRGCCIRGGGLSRLLWRLLLHLLLLSNQGLLWSAPSNLYPIYIWLFVRILALIRLLIVPALP